MKVLLLNPPGDKIYLRDYYCSKVSKADYLYEPTDLLILSGILGQEHELGVIDAIAMHYDGEHCLAAIKAFSPQAVIFVTGAVSYQKDIEFLAAVKKATGALLLGSGDIFLGERTEALLQESPFIDAVLLDFTDVSVLDYLRERKPCRNIVSRDNDGIVFGAVERGKGGEFHIPCPRHSLFPLARYQYPFVRSADFAVVLTDYGCAFKCKFCVMSGIGFKVRALDGVMEELRGLRKTGIREIYFNDQTFGAQKTRTRQLLDRMIDERLGFGWCCFTRVDVVDREILLRMKRAGCHTVMFGVESANQRVRDEHLKGIKTARILEMISVCRSVGIMTVATFIIGLPGDTRDTIGETIAFSLSCGCDFASFNVAVPRMGTSLRRELLETRGIDPLDMEMDQSGGRAHLKTGDLSLTDIEDLKDQAVKRFYGRPGYLFSQFLRIRNLYDLRRKMRGFMTLMNSPRKKKVMP